MICFRVQETGGCENKSNQVERVSLPFVVQTMPVQRCTAIALQASIEREMQRAMGSKVG